MDTAYLFSALVWGSVGFGFFIYGKKQKSLAHLLGGILLMSASYFAKTPLYLSLAGIVIIAGIYMMKRIM